MTFNVTRINVGKVLNPHMLCVTHRINQFHILYGLHIIYVVPINSQTSYTWYTLMDSLVAGP